MSATRIALQLASAASLRAEPTSARPSPAWQVDSHPEVKRFAVENIRLAEVGAKGQVQGTVQ